MYNVETNNADLIFDKEQVKLLLRKQKLTKGREMLTLKAHYEKGKLEFEKLPDIDKAEVLITFLDFNEPQAKSHPAKIDIEGIKKKPSSVTKWIGALKGADISNWKKEKADYLAQKYQ